ncbi:hypothetical protein [Paenibacillus lacisoli]|nr:hypothetical protein [Paenibacillus sp. JX-17]
MNQQPSEKNELPPRSRVDYPRRSHQEEYSAEIAPSHTRASRSERSTADQDQGQGLAQAGKAAGYVGVALGIASLFMWSIVLGPTAAVLGYYAFVNGRKLSGAWAIGLGLLATISYFIMIPFAR